MGRKPHQGIGNFLWSVVWLALCAYSPQRVRGHNSLPTAGAGGHISSASWVFGSQRCLFGSFKCVPSCYILDMSVKSTQVNEVIFEVKLFILNTGDFMGRKKNKKEDYLCLI